MAGFMGGHRSGLITRTATLGPYKDSHLSITRTATLGPYYYKDSHLRKSYQDSHFRGYQDSHFRGYQDSHFSVYWLIFEGLFSTPHQAVRFRDKLSVISTNRPLFLNFRRSYPIAIIILNINVFNET